MDLIYQKELPGRIIPAYSKDRNPVCICFAANEQYAHPLTIALYSLLRNADRERCYDILILTKDINKESQDSINQLSKLAANITIRFLDMSKVDLLVQSNLRGYITVETNYRLFLLSDFFLGYDRILYLDCDILVLTDVCSLYDTELGTAPMGAVPAYNLRQNMYYKNPIINQQKAYSALNYCKEMIGLETIDQYFNAGVLLLQLQVLRKLTDEKRAIDLLMTKAFRYNDQDILNYIVHGDYYQLDVSWNYQNFYEGIRHSNNQPLMKVFDDVFCTSPGLIHYVGGIKPWQDSTVEGSDYYTQYEEKYKLWLQERSKKKEEY